MPLIVLLVLTAGASFVIGLLAPALWRPRRTWPRPAGQAADSGHAA
jgi:hypothetical protein